MVTFVTAFLDLLEDRSNDKSVDICFSHFANLCQSGISLVVFLSKVYMEKAIHAPNLHYIEIELCELATYSEGTKEPLSLPESRTDYHDTLHFMILMNAKIEFVQRAMDRNPFSSTHFAWIDFSICHVFRNLPASLRFLSTLAQSSLPELCLAFPGCWDKGQGSMYLRQAINWRYCGGFFLGDAKSLRSLYDLYRIAFPKWLGETKTMMWEVNMWHKLELDGWNCTWYRANHDDSILRIPPAMFTTVASLTTIPSRISTTCRTTIDSLLSQVAHIYLSVARHYERFQTGVVLPNYLSEEPYASKVTVVLCDDKGPATKYLGALHMIPKDVWIFFCDDDQEYAPNLLDRMRSPIEELCVYQNRYHTIQTMTSGGLIHGYVGNLGHASLFQSLPSFPLPPCAFHVDDQWMSIYCFLKEIAIRPTGVERYVDIFRTLEDGHECIGADSLFSLGTRDERVQQLADVFHIRFLDKGRMEHSEK